MQPNNLYQNLPLSPVFRYWLETSYSVCHQGFVTWGNAGMWLWQRKVSVVQCPVQFGSWTCPVCSELSAAHTHWAPPGLCWPFQEPRAAPEMPPCHPTWTGIFGKVVFQCFVNFSQSTGLLSWDEEELLWLHKFELLLFPSVFLGGFLCCWIAVTLFFEISDKVFSSPCKAGCSWICLNRIICLPS